jgi:hypothetical protein
MLAAPQTLCTMIHPDGSVFLNSLSSSRHSGEFLGTHVNRVKSEGAEPLRLRSLVEPLSFYSTAPSSIVLSSSRPRRFGLERGVGQSSRPAEAHEPLYHPPPRNEQGRKHYAQTATN